MPDKGQYDRNMQHMLTRLIKCVVFDGTKYVSFKNLDSTYALAYSNSSAACDFIY